MPWAVFPLRFSCLDHRPFGQSQKKEIPMKKLAIFALLPLLCSCGGSAGDPLDFTYTVKEGDSVRISWNSNSTYANAGDILTVKENQVILETPSKTVTSILYSPVLTDIATQTWTGASGNEYKYNCFYIKKETSSKSGRVKRTFTGKVSLAMSEITSYVEAYTDIHEGDWTSDEEYAEHLKEYEESDSPTKYFSGSFKALITEEEYERYSQEGGAITFTPFWSASWGDYSITEEKEMTVTSVNILVSQAE